MPRKRTSILALTVAVIIASAIVYEIGCATTPKGWRSTVAELKPADLMEGSWEGTWASDSKPLKGKLTAIIEKLPDGTYRASFNSQTPFGDEKSLCNFRVQDRSGPWKFQGKEELGLLKGGTYTYTGTVDGHNFTCTYDSTFDKGVFRMERR